MKTGTIIASKRAGSSCQDTKRKSKYKKQKCNIGPTRSLTEKPVVYHEGLRFDDHDNNTIPSVDVPSKRQTRSQKPPPITCLNYGKDREVKYPAYFFCSNCKKFEERNAFKTVPAPYLGNRATSHRYRCTAGHTRPEQPTVKKDEKLHCYMTSRHDNLNKEDTEPVVMSKTGRSTRKNTNRVSYKEDDDSVASKEIMKPIACTATTTSTSTTSQYEDQMISTTRNIKSVFHDKDNDLAKSSNDKDDNSAISNYEHNEFEKVKSLEFLNNSLKKEIDDIKNKLDFSEKMRFDLEDSHRISVEYLQQEICSLKTKIELNKQKNLDLLTTKRILRKEQMSNQRLNSRVIELTNQNENVDIASLIPVHISLDDFFLLLVPQFEKVASRKNRLHTNMSDRLIEFLWNSKFLSGCVRSSINEFTKTYFRKTIFSPARILQLLDMNGGQLSYQGLDLLRDLETNGEKYIYPIQ